MIPLKFSTTSKMPCSSFSLPAQACKTGRKLAKIQGSVCHGCYALKGNYNFEKVKNARNINLASLPQGKDWSGWIESMIASIERLNKTGFFRWHDSGDLQSIDHLLAIAKIAKRMPEVQFWLPTKEQGIVRKYLKTNELPDNLIIRVSSPMIDQLPIRGFAWTSTVHDKDAPIGYECQAPKQGGSCGDCRACWDKTVKNVSYKKH